jgi:hypothetical protein
MIRCMRRQRGDSTSQLKWSPGIGLIKMTKGMVLLSEAIQKVSEHISEPANILSLLLHRHSIAKDPTPFPAGANNLISLKIYSAFS